MKYTVLITTSGLGSRLRQITKYTNKSLVSIGNKYALCYIIELYPPDTEYIITLGHFGSHVRDFLGLSYPKRTFVFVDIDKYDGAGSSLGYSMLCAKTYLQKPFIFHACDTIVLNNCKCSDTCIVPYPEYNFVFGYKNNGQNMTQYRTINTTANIVLSVNEKGCANFDYYYIGLIGIKDYKVFWLTLENIYTDVSVMSGITPTCTTLSRTLFTDISVTDTSLSDCHVVGEMLKTGIIFNMIEVSQWYDIGNIEALTLARKSITDKYDILYKDDESICIMDDCVIKFFHNSSMCLNRVERANILDGLVPKIIGHTNNFYKYNFVNGTLSSQMYDINLIEKLLTWSYTNLWIKTSQPTDFYERCVKFYFNKTLERCKQLYSITGINDKIDMINNINTHTVCDLLDMIDKKNLCDVNTYRIHGDFILDNIICIDKHVDFVLLDWRQDFGGDLYNGDIYYDFAKLHHNIILNHDNLQKNLYSIKMTVDDGIFVDVKCNYMLTSQLNKFEKFITNNGFDWHKVKLLTYIIWINMAPLHHYPLNMFLYYFGKYNLHCLLYLS